MLAAPAAADFIAMTGWQGKLTQENLRTALFSTHLALGARIVPFGGWDMPVQYSGIIAEVNAVRTSLGIFDVSHMGRLYISGPRSTEFLDWVLTGAVESLRVGRARYCMICNEAGGIIDDTIFYRLAHDRYLLIPNAGNRATVVAWFQRWIDERFPDGCSIDDQTSATALIACQGPKAAQVLDRLCPLIPGPASSGSKAAGPSEPSEPSGLPFFAWGEATLSDKPIFIGRTGYTGEDGFELVVASEDTQIVWQSLLEHDAVPCGLGARDVLRLEAGLPLHGHEIDPQTSPIEAGLSRFVRFDKDYVGAAALRQQHEGGVDRALVGLKLPGRSAPRQGYPILLEGNEIGRTTSGSYSPTLDTSIAMGYVLVRYATLGQMLDVDIRGRNAQAEVAPLPFYTRPGR